MTAAPRSRMPHPAPPADPAAGGELRADPSRLHDSYIWYRAVEVCGNEGRRWIARYRAARPQEILAGTQRLLVLSRRRDLPAAGRLLAETESRLEGLGAQGSLLHVLRRFYRGAAAYYYYALGRYPRAEASSQAAADHIRQAIELDRFLLPLAHQCHEILIQQARIARARRRWERMRALLREVEEMLADRCPYCVLADGTEIRLSDLIAFQRSLPGLGEAERSELSTLREAGALRDLGRRYIQQLHALPGFLIPYP